MRHPEKDSADSGSSRIHSPRMPDRVFRKSRNASTWVLRLIVFRGNRRLVRTQVAEREVDQFSQVTG